LCQKVGLVRVSSAPKVIDVEDVKQINRKNDMLDSIAEQENENANRKIKLNNK
jgi:hypothetical protein